MFVWEEEAKRPWWVEACAMQCLVLPERAPPLAYGVFTLEMREVDSVSFTWLNSVRFRSVPIVLLTLAANPGSE